MTLLNNLLFSLYQYVIRPKYDLYLLDKYLYFLFVQRMNYYLNNGKYLKNKNILSCMYDNIIIKYL